MPPNIDYNKLIPVTNLSTIINDRCRSLSVPLEYKTEPEDFVPILVAITNLPFCNTPLSTYTTKDALTPAGAKLIVALMPEVLQEFVQYDINVWFFNQADHRYR